MEVKQPAQPHSAATLSNVSGQDLAKEVRAILISQHAAKNQSEDHANSSNGSIYSCQTKDYNNTFKPVQAPPSPPPSTPKKGEMFGGIEAAAHTSRMRHIAAAKASEVFVEDECCETTASVGHHLRLCGTAASRVKRRLRWHALVDSGMGRLGFRTEPVPRNGTSGTPDTVDIIKEMVDAEVHTDAPLGTSLSRIV